MSTYAERRQKAADRRKLDALFKAAGYPARERRLYVRALGSCGRSVTGLTAQPSGGVRLDKVE